MIGKTTKSGSFFAGALIVSLALPASAAEKIYRVGFLGANQGGWGLYMSVPGHLGFLGHEKGQEIVYEIRQSVESLDELPELAAELVEWKADVVVAIGAAASLAAAKTTDTTPIVAMVFSDPVDMGLVDSLARPGRNVTGIVLREEELIGKRLELLRELVPQLERVGVVLNPSTPLGASTLQTTKTVASRTRLSLVPVAIDVMNDALPALQDAIASNCEALLVVSDGASWQHLRRHR
jgi:putative ABC transport system substrate-binding protein